MATIEITKAEAKEAGVFKSEMYENLKEAREATGYKVVVKETKRKADTNLNALVSSINATDKIGICYVTRITAMKELNALAVKLGYSPICIWSTSNQDHHMTDEQLAVRKQILEDFTIPEKYNLLIINASCGTSIKIKSRVTCCPSVLFKGLTAHTPSFLLEYAKRAILRFLACLLPRIRLNPLLDSLRVCKVCLWSSKTQGFPFLIASCKILLKVFHLLVFWNYNQSLSVFPLH